jgi:hypothetical protein
MRRDFWDRHASRLKTVDDAPEPLRTVMLAALKAEDSAQFLVFGPAEMTGGERSAATLLAVLNHGWVVVRGTKQTEPVLTRCEFANTLLVEITSILLYGRMRIDFVKNGRVDSVAIHFNTVMEGLYHEASEMVLNGMDGIFDNEPRQRGESDQALNLLPLKFCNAMSEFVPMGQRVLSLVHWPAVLGRRLRLLQQELAPEAVLALTDRELLFISEEKSWFWVRTDRVQKYGNVVTHCPLSRVGMLQLSEHASLATIDVEIRTGQTGEKIKIDFPPDHVPEVVAFVEKATKQRTAVDLEVKQS